jgi:ABC-type uncharacterized transport system permease subunit
MALVEARNLTKIFLPLVGVYCIWLARGLFRRGLLRYDSSGH